MHPNRQFLGIFVVHMPSQARFSLCHTSFVFPWVVVGGGEGTVILGIFPRGVCRDCRPFVHEKVRKSTKKCESEENRELRIGTKMYENVRIVGMMDMTFLPI